MMSGILGWPSDARLVSKVRSGHKQDYAVLVERHYGLAQAIAFAHTGNLTESEDIAQEAFLRAYVSLDTLRDGGRFRSWLASIARNLAVTRLRLREREVPIEHARAIATETDFASAELHELVWKCIARLDDPLREAVTLHYFHGLKLREVAELVDATPAAVGKRLQRARESLGADLLSRLESKGGAFSINKRSRNATLAALGGTAAAWEASAATGAGMTLGAWALAGALAVVGGLTYVTTSNSAPPDSAKQTDAAMLAPAAAPSSSNAAGAIGPEGATEAETPDGIEAAVESLRTPGGPGTLSLMAYRIDGTPAAGYTLRVERIDWDEFSPPPPHPIAEEFILDAQGETTVDNLPHGRYMSVAFGEGQADLAEFVLEAEDEKARVILQMLPASPLAGKVLMPDGNPAAGAIVYPHMRRDTRERQVEHIHAAALRMETDAEGRFSAPYFWDGAYSFYAETRDGLAGVSDFAPLGADFTVPLQHPGTLEGQVVREDSGEPVKGVQLVLEGDCHRDHRKILSDESGRFVLPKVRPGTRWYASDDSVMLLSEGCDRPEIRPAETVSSVVKVVPGAVLMGRVFDQATGEGIEKASIYFNGSSGHKSVETDKLGSFYVGGIRAPEAVRLSVRGPANLYRSVPGMEERLVTLDRAGETEIEVHMLANPVVSGRVEGLGATNPRRARVFAWGERGSANAFTTPDGRFRLGGLVGDKLTVYAYTDVAFSAKLEIATLPAEGMDDLVLPLNLPRTGHLHGIVPNPDAAKLAMLSDSRVTLNPKDPDNPCEDSARIWGGRQFDMDGLVPGEYMLTAMREYNPIAKPIPVTILPDGALTTIELKLEEVQVQGIQGRVVDKRGKPIEGASFSTHIDSISTTTDPNGGFILYTPKPINYGFTVTHPDYSTYTFDGAADAAELFVEMRDRATIEGIVLDAMTRAPVTGYSLTPMYPGSEIFPTGRFTLRNVDVTALPVAVRAPGYVLNAIPFPEPEEEGSRPIEVLLTPGKGFSALVLNTVGVPVSGVAVYVNYTSSNPHTPPAAMSDAEGRFSLDDLPQEELTLYLRHPDYATLVEKVLPPGGNPQRFVLKGGGSLECVIELDSSVEVKALRMGLDVGEDHIGSRFPEGERTPGGMRYTATWEMITPGQAVASVYFQFEKSDFIEGSSYLFPVSIVNGEKAVLVKRLPAPTGSLEVRVTRDGLPAKGLQAAVHIRDYDMHSGVHASSAGDGVITFVALPEGLSTLQLGGNLDGAEFRWSQQVCINSGAPTQLSLDISDVARASLPDCGGCFLALVPEEEYERVMSEPGVNARQRISAMNFVELFPGTEQDSALLKPGDYRVIPYGPSPDGPPKDLAEVLEEAFPLRLEAGENPAIALP